MTNRDLSAQQTKEEWRSYYSDLSLGEGETLFQEEYDKYVDTHGWHNSIRVIREYGMPHDGEKVLDAGCGWGRMLMGLADNYTNLDITAIDMSSDAIDIGKKNIGTNANGNDIDWQIGDLQNLPFEDAQFDVAYSSRVFQHLNDPSRGVAEILRVLKPGGRFVIYLQNKLCPLNASYYSRLYSPSTVRSWFSGVTTKKLQVKSMDFYHGKLSYPRSMDKRMSIERSLESVPVLNQFGGKVIAYGEK